MDGLSPFRDWFTAALARAVLVLLASCLLAVALVPPGGGARLVIAAWVTFAVVRVLAWGVERWNGEHDD